MFAFINIITLKNKKKNKLTITIVAPVGLSNINDKISPIINDTIDMIELTITTLLKLLQISLPETAGKIIKLEIKREPINRIPNTTTKEHSIAKIML